MKKTMKMVRCLKKAEVGHTNLWGTPYLKFDARCSLPEGHEGPHESDVPIDIAGSRVKNIELFPNTIRMRWEEM